LFGFFEKTIAGNNVEYSVLNSFLSLRSNVTYLVFMYITKHSHYDYIETL